MSAWELRNFENQLTLLSYTEQLAILDFLSNLLQKRQENIPNENTEHEIEKINAVLDKIPEAEQMEYCDAGLENVREALKNDSW
ncbi:MAG: hypothetical protein J6Y30_03390 [Treponema sp.]|nr:hypothetical protein [Treponema sp.]